MSSYQGTKGRLQKKIPALPQTELGQVHQISQVGHPGYLRPQQKLGQLVPILRRHTFQGTGQLQSRPAAALQKGLWPLLIPVEVGGENHRVHSLLCLHAEHFYAGLHIRSPIVHAGENVGVQIGHRGGSSGAASC